MNNREFKQISPWEKWGKRILRQLALQSVLLMITVTVLFPVLWVVAMATDSRGLARYSELILIPRRISLNAFQTLLFEPLDSYSTATQEVYFTRLLSNSLFVALGTALLSVGLGATAAYAFSRFRFIGRRMGMLGFIVLLMMPATGTLVPLIAIFSLFKIHVLFSALAPSIFFGVLAALFTWALRSGVQSIYKQAFFTKGGLTWVPPILTLFIIFGLFFLGWIVMYTASDTYDITIREGLRSSNDIEEEIIALQNDMQIQKDTNIPRQERRLAEDKAERKNAETALNNVAERFPDAFALAGSLSTFNNGLTNIAPTLLSKTYTLNDVQSIILAGMDANVANQQVRVDEVQAEYAANQKLLQETQKRYDDARAPYFELRNKVIGKLVPYMLASMLVALVVAGLIWWVGLSGVPQGTLLYRDQFARLQYILYATIIIVVSYSWFNANYESPTKAIGLDGGGLWYDVRISFRSEDKIAEELAPYIERTDLEASRAQLEEQGLDTFRTERQDQLASLDTIIAELAAIDLSLDPPDNLTRQEKIDWKDARRREQKAALTDIQNDAKDFIGNTNRFNLLPYEEIKAELMGLLKERQGDLKLELGYVAVDDLEVALRSFDQKISSLPNDAKEKERLEKEFAIRSSNSGNVNETLRITLFGLMIAYSSGALPFSIWNLKGYFDTIPRELEEAALVDGTNMAGTFFRIILPLSLPALAITILFAFMTGWTEFILAWKFLSDNDRITLAMALRGMSSSGENQPPPDYPSFAAMSILMAIPVVSLFYIFQRWIVSGLTVGGVKG